MGIVSPFIVTKLKYHINVYLLLIVLTFFLTFNRDNLRTDPSQTRSILATLPAERVNSA